MFLLLIVLLVFLFIDVCSGIATSSSRLFKIQASKTNVNINVLSNPKFQQNVRNHLISLYATKSGEENDETTEKYGLEAGLLKAAQNPDGNSKVKAGDLLKKYGIAYLATSITLAIISYALCYFLVANGVDVSALLEKVGITATETASSAGTAGIAYALHKAASPIRFPPTVALTPIVAGWLGKKPKENETK